MKSLIVWTWLCLNLALTRSLLAETLANSSSTPLPYSSSEALSDPDSICSMPAGEFQKIIASKGQPWAIDSQYVRAMGDANVVVVGEMHIYTDQKALAETIRMFHRKKSDNACVAFEMPDGPLGVKGLLNQIEEKILRAKSMGYGRTGFEDIYDYYSPMASLAESLGMKLKAVDHPERLETDLSLEQRNRAMGLRLSKLIRSGECGAVLLFVGKVHEATREPPRISDFLKQAGLKTVTLNLQMTREQGVTRLFRTWPNCSPPQLNQPILVESSAFSGDLRLLPLSSERVRWRDFDYTLLVP